MAFAFVNEKCLIEYLICQKNGDETKAYPLHSNWRGIRIHSQPMGLASDSTDHCEVVPDPFGLGFVRLLWLRHLHQLE